MVIPAVLTVLLMVESQLLLVVLLADAIVFLLGLADLFTLPRANWFVAEREMQRVASLGKNHAVSLHVENASTRTITIALKDDLPPDCYAEPAEFEIALAPRARTTATYDLRVSRRGAFTLENIHIRVGSRLGLWQRYIVLPVRTVLHVYPDMKQLAEYAILARTNRLSLLGVRRTRKIGTDNDFERLRDYTPDDNYKFIDWRASARRRKLTVKDFQTSQSQRLIFMLDCGRMMTNEASGHSLLDHALNATLMLSYVALRQGDSVGMIAFADEIIGYVPPQGGMAQMNRLLHASFNRFPALVESRYDDAFLYLNTHCRKRSLVVLITNLIDEVNSLAVQNYLTNLVGKHLPLGVLLRDRRLFSLADREPVDRALGILDRLIGNVSSMRQGFLQRIMDPRRDIEDEAGLPRLGDYIAPQAYQQLYERDAIAARVVEVLPRESWQVQPLVYEQERSGVSTPFEEDLARLGRDLRGEHSWLEPEQSHPLWDYARRGDEQCGVGAYGVVLVGTDDGLPLSAPALGIAEEHSAPAGQDAPAANARGVWRLAVNEASRGMRRCQYLRVFPEALAQITRWESNPTSPRFGQPVEYLLTFHDPSLPLAAAGIALATRQVHWTRVVHLADNLTSSEVAGAPRMRAVWNNLLGLHKLYAGDPEMYWRGAFGGYSFETHPEMGGDVDVDRDAMRDMIERYQNGLQRYLLLLGMSAKSLAPQISDPTAHIAAQIDAICIRLGIPRRIFVGSERGELASSQDDAAWNDRLRARQRTHITPRVIAPLIDRLILLGVLRRPETGYRVWWPDLTSQSDQERATVAATRTQAMATYLGSDLGRLMGPRDYLTRVHGYSEEEAGAILESAAPILPAAPTPAEPAPVQQQQPTTTVITHQVPVAWPIAEPAIAARSTPLVNVGSEAVSIEAGPTTVHTAEVNLLVDNLTPIIHLTPAIDVQPAGVEVHVEPARIDLAPLAGVLADAIGRQTEVIVRSIDRLTAAVESQEPPLVEVQTPEPQPVAFRIETLADGSRRITPEE
jgi:uncharacterized protein (DUF58 family)